MREKLSEIISWRIQGHHARIWIKNDHSGYVLYVDRVDKGEFLDLKEACAKMNELLKVKL